MKVITPFAVKAGQKAIDVDHMIGGMSFEYNKDGGLVPVPSKTIQQQVTIIMNENQNYEFSQLIHHSSGNTINMEYATLIVNVKDESDSIEDKEMIEHLKNFIRSKHLTDEWDKFRENL
jgi:hypothetical protein